MTVRFYFDHHIPSAIVDALRRRGIDCLTAAEDGRQRTSDEALPERSSSLRRLMVTNDSDFDQIAKECWTTGRIFSGIVLTPLMSMTIGAIVNDLELLASASDMEEWQNRLGRLPL